MTEVVFCPECGLELVGDKPCWTCEQRVKLAVAQQEREERREAFQRQAPVSEELQKYLNRNNVRGEAREKALGMMGALNGVGFNVHSSFPWWMTWTSEKGEEVFADSFFDPGKCRLLWKDLGSEETGEAVLELCSRAGVPAYFPFAYKEPTNG